MAHPSPGDGASFDSGNMDPEDAFRLAPQVEGTWTFFCEIHPGSMLNSTINVTAAGRAAPGRSGAGQQSDRIGWW